MRKSRRARTVLPRVVVAMMAGLLAACSSGGPASAPSRARAYANVDACLLTGPGGVSSPAVAPVWAGMEDVSVTGRVRASYLTVPSPETAASAQSHLNSLIVQKCALIIAVGAPERAAVLAEARRFPSVHFVVLGAAAQVSPNVDALAFTTAGTRAAVANAVRTVAG
jgi:basic membrane lipoprotein Med (substrate-binding protein (PBP1-ABC) superfamily)